MASHGITSDPAMHFLVLAQFAVCIICTLGLALHLVFFRKPPALRRHWVVLVAIAVVLPISNMALQQPITLLEVPQVRMCGSCHVMKSYVDDMENCASRSLAAAHYCNGYAPRDQCYTCHAGQDLTGFVEAKIAGVLDVVHFVSNSYPRPLRMRSDGYPNRFCLQCHQGTKFNKAHEDSLEDVLSNRARCMDCHSRRFPAHIVPPGVSASYKGGNR